MTSFPSHPELPPPLPGQGAPPSTLGFPEDPATPALLAFFDLDGASLALAQSEFTQEELIRKLVEYVRHPSPKVAQTGIRQFLAYLTTVAKFSGAVASAKRTLVSNPDGSPLVTETLSRSVLSTLTRKAPPPQPHGRTFIPPSVASPPPPAPEVPPSLAGSDSLPRPGPDGVSPPPGPGPA